MAPTINFFIVRDSSSATATTIVTPAPSASSDDNHSYNTGIASKIPILLLIICLVIWGALRLFVMIRWYFGFNNLKDPIAPTQSSNPPPKYAYSASSKTASTETLVEHKIAAPAPAHTAAVDNTALGSEDALFELARANTQKNSAVPCR
ncbi:hypothetical protein C8R43DRAFT_1128972 [Mycena crocata]|nr:hypothetical protein C8R43DRAFT_1128972 [Mycena crocata]